MKTKSISPVRFVRSLINANRPLRTAPMPQMNYKVEKGFSLFMEEQLHNELALMQDYLKLCNMTVHCVPKKAVCTDELKTLAKKHKVNIDLLKEEAALVSVEKKDKATQLTHNTKTYIVRADKDVTIANQIKKIFAE